MIVMIPEKGKPILWEEMTWPEVEQFVKKMDMAILPTAATEQAGYASRGKLTAKGIGAERSGT